MRSFSYQLMGVDAPFDPEYHFTTSWLLSPNLLACLRGLIALYCSTVTITIYSYDAAHGATRTLAQSFSYFTSLTYWGLNFYFIVSTVHTTVYARTGHTWLQKWPRPLQALHSLFYTSIVTLPFLVTLVFWIVIYLPPWFSVTFDGWSNVQHPPQTYLFCETTDIVQISQHALNSLFALIELILPATRRPPWLHLAFLIVILLLYLAVAYITHATEGFYTYDFLDMSKGKGRVAGYCFGILAAIAVIFVAVWGAIWLRERNTGPAKRSKRDTGEHEVYSDLEMIVVGTK
jgi:hypothetical protein